MEKHIPIKNYIKVTLIFIVTIVFVLVLRVIYKNSNDYKYRKSILHDIVNEAKADNIYNYITENDDSLVYICVSNNKMCRDFDLKLKEYISTVDGLSRQMVYLNIREVINKKNFLTELSNKYKIVNKIETYPVFILFKDGKVKEVIENKDQDIIMNNLKSLINEYDLGE